MRRLFGVCLRQGQRRSVIHNEQAKRRIRINVGNLAIGVGEQPGRAQMHATAPIRMQLRMQQAHDGRETDARTVNEGALRKPGTGDNIGELGIEFKSDRLHRIRPQRYSTI